MIATITLRDVYESLNQGEYRQAAQQLQTVLHTAPSADAWYLAAELTLEKDRDRAIRHLKRALLLDPRHGDALTLLGQLGESRELTVADVAEEVVEVVDQQTSKTPLLRRLSPRQRLAAIGGLAVLLIVLVIVVIPALIPRSGPAFIPSQAPKAEQVALLPPNAVFALFTGGDIPLYDAERIGNAVTPGKDTLRFSVSGAGGELQPVQVVVYESISDLIHDRETQRQLEATANIVASNNVLLVYDKSLQGLPIENRLLHNFQVIAGV